MSDGSVLALAVETEVPVEMFGVEFRLFGGEAITAGRALLSRVEPLNQ